MPSNIFQIPPALLFLLFIWSTFWKGLALWKAARKKQKNWFIILLVVSTGGLLEIVFLFFFAEEKLNAGTFFKQK